MSKRPTPIDTIWIIPLGSTSEWKVAKAAIARVTSGDVSLEAALTEAHAAREDGTETAGTEAVIKLDWLLREHRATLADVHWTRKGTPMLKVKRRPGTLIPASLTRG